MNIFIGGLCTKVTAAYDAIPLLDEFSLACENLSTRVFVLTIYHYWRNAVIVILCKYMAAAYAVSTRT